MTAKKDWYKLIREICDEEAAKVQQQLLTNVQRRIKEEVSPKVLVEESKQETSFVARGGPKRGVPNWSSLQIAMMIAKIEYCYGDEEDESKHTGDDRSSRVSEDSSPTIVDGRTESGSSVHDTGATKD